MISGRTGCPTSRDAFDSSFDAVIELQRLTCMESHAILSERAIGFPKSLSAICHAWSGGLPRDLIRVSRRCVELRRTTKISRIDYLASLAVSQDITETLIALRTTEHQLKDDDDKPTPSALTALINDLNRMGRGIADDTDLPADDTDLTVTTALSDLLCNFLSTRDNMHSAVRSSATKLLVSGILAVTFAAAATHPSEAMSGEQIFAIADTIAIASSLQDEPLGEMIAAANEAISEMRRLDIPVPLNLNRMAASNDDSLPRQAATSLCNGSCVVAETVDYNGKDQSLDRRQARHPVNQSWRT